MNMSSIPKYLRQILNMAPSTHVNEDGFLVLEGEQNGSNGPVALAQTQWNIDRDHFLDRLLTDQPWGIVLHWYGDGNEFDDSLTGYLRGFDSLRTVEDYITRTSAHFLIGDQKPSTTTDKIGIIQTQKPYADGIPTLASHIHELDTLAHSEGEQYFVRALYQLAFANPAIHSVLQDWFDGPRVDPNDVTIAIEIAGKEFHKIHEFPSKQKVASTISLIWALMERYQINASNILGHHEIDLRKPDPGKEFLGLIRILIGLKALLADDDRMKDLVFGQYIGEDNNYDGAIHAYFKVIRDYLVLVDTPKELYEWEKMSKYWFVFEAVTHENTVGEMANRFIPPIEIGENAQILRAFDPNVLEGVDIFCEGDENKLEPKPVRLTAPGVCLYKNEVITGGQTRSAIFRHRLLTGSEIISIYSNLSSVGNLSVGTTYPLGYKLGAIDCRQVSFASFLRFAIAYAGTWDTEYKDRPYTPENVSSEWIEKHFLDPLAFIEQQNLQSKFNRLIAVPQSAY